MAKCYSCDTVTGFVCPNRAHSTCKSKGTGMACDEHSHTFTKNETSFKLCKACAEFMITSGCDPVTGAAKIPLPGCILL